MDYTIRQLTSPDLDLLKQLLKVFGEAFQDIETYQDHLPTDAYLLNLLGKENFIVVVAILQKQVVGGLAAYVLDKFEQNRREIYIYDLAVAENHRRKGIATRLIQELQSIARDRKAYVIFVQADPPDMPAVKLYESVGTKEEVYHFDILP
jgi:aminoglycoside 3-N-acetyltransferase I